MSGDDYDDGCVVAGGQPVAERSGDMVQRFGRAPDDDEFGIQFLRNLGYGSGDIPALEHEPDVSAEVVRYPFGFGSQFSGDLLPRVLDAGVIDRCTEGCAGGAEWFDVDCHEPAVATCSGSGRPGECVPAS